MRAKKVDLKNNSQYDLDLMWYLWCGADSPFFGKDSRITNIVLTQKGEDFKVMFEKISEELNKTLYKNLSSDESKLIEKLLRKVLE